MSGSRDMDSPHWNGVNPRSKWGQKQALQNEKLQQKFKGMCTQHGRPSRKFAIWSPTATRGRTALFCAVFCTVALKRAQPFAIVLGHGLALFNGDNPCHGYHVSFWHGFRGVVFKSSWENSTVSILTRGISMKNNRRLKTAVIGIHVHSAPKILRLRIA